MSKVLHLFLQVVLWIWQFPQNLLGLVLSVSRISKQVYPKTSGQVSPKEDIEVIYTSNFFGAGWGASLGSFILLDKWYLTCSSRYQLQTIKHEHGHQIQSRIFGPLYLIVIGIPSGLGNLWDRFFHKSWSSLQSTMWYYGKLPWERWADKLGKVLPRW